MNTVIADRQIRPAQSLATPALSRGALGLRLGALGLAAIMLLCAGLYVWHWNYFAVGTYLDDAHYIVTARGLASGVGFALINYPSLTPELKYPPGFPLLLAPIAAVAGDRLDLYKLPNLALALATMPIWFVLLKRWLPIPAALLVLAAFGTNTQIAESSTMVLSEPLFLFVLSLLLLAVDSWVKPDRGRLSARQCFGLAGLLIALSLVRTTGEVFAAVLLGFLLINRRFRETVIVALPLALLFLAWAWRNHGVGGGFISAGYEQELVSAGSRVAGPSTWFSATIERLLFNANFYVTIGLPDSLSMSLRGESIGRIVSNIEATLHAPWLTDVMGASIGLLAVAGIVLRARNRHYPELAAVAYLLVLLVWSGQASRLLNPITPLLYLGVYEVVAKGAGFVRRDAAGSWLRRAAPLIAVALLVTWNVGRNAESMMHAKRNPMDFAIGSRWLAQHTPADAVITTEWPILRYLYADRHMIDLPRATSDDGTVRRILDSDANYVLIAPPHYTYDATLDDTGTATLRAMAAHPDTFSRVFSDERRRVSVWEITR